MVAEVCLGKVGAVAAPVGFVKVGDRIGKDPDRRVQEAIRLAIDKLAGLGSVRQALLWFPRAWARAPDPGERRTGHLAPPTLGHAP